MEKSRNQYGRNFREAIAQIHKLPPSERSAMSNRQGSTVPKPSPKPKRSS